MASGLFALLDDIAAIAKVAAASIDDIGTMAASSLDDTAAAAARAGSKAAGVVIDDAAVTPRYVVGFSADRELPIVAKIARGSLKNKVLLLLPGALALAYFLPMVITPLLMAGGAFLCFEGAEKLWEKLSPHDDAVDADVAMSAKAREEMMVSGAIRTDLILSAEIMAIALGTVEEAPIAEKAIALLVVALGITVLVYGAVALIVKADDAGVHLVRRHTGLLAALGRGLVAGMPPFLSLLSWVGMAAMLWVGGHIVIDGLNKLGVPLLHDLLHGAMHAVEGAGALVTWLVEAGGSGLFGLALGAVIVILLHMLPRKRAAGEAGSGH
jgi:predicted DNA repair protein MutK